MTQQVDRSALVGAGALATVPPIVTAIVKILHPSIYTLACRAGYHDGAPQCYAADVAEAVLQLVFWLGVGIFFLATFMERLRANPSPPDGMRSANIPNGSIPVVGSSTGSGTQVAHVDPATTTVTTVVPKT